MQVSSGGDSKEQPVWHCLDDSGESNDDDSSQRFVRSLAGRSLESSAGKLMLILDNTIHGRQTTVSPVCGGSKKTGTAAPAALKEFRDGGNRLCHCEHNEGNIISVSPAVGCLTDVD